jgi:tripartite-type tricarboxylate transporter receptor subunit TctC
MGDFSRRAILAGGGCVTLSQLVFPGCAQDQALKIIMPYAAGGSADSIARLLAERLQASLGRGVIVESRTGGGGRIGLIGSNRRPRMARPSCLPRGANIPSTAPRT